MTISVTTWAKPVIDQKESVQRLKGFFVDSFYIHQPLSNLSSTISLLQKPKISSSCKNVSTDWLIDWVQKFQILLSYFSVLVTHRLLTNKNFNRFSFRREVHVAW